MTVTAQHIRDTLSRYLDRHPEDEGALSALTGSLADTPDTITSRKEFRGHATAGALLLRPDGHVLLIEHKALGTWLFPGGHLEDTDTTLIGAALRELGEETGIPAGSVTPAGPVPLHVDVHPIPANPAKDEPVHQHYDFRYLFRTDTPHLITLQAEEVTGCAWQPAGTLTAEPLRSRLLTALTR
ncbi:NUDIX hydrolase [Streptomyces sp. NPDC020983]|uniref:NUDIX hydrolase n=1 Tax=Streptomyces sp. NPDC020983 TaxID=3365106 RepID=UPI00379217C1